MDGLLVPPREFERFRTTSRFQNFVTALGQNPVRSLADGNVVLY